MKRYIYVINRGITFLAVCLSFIGCGNADIGNIETLTERPAFVLHQTLPEELCGTWYDVQGWENYNAAGQYNISKEGVLHYNNYTEYFIDYANQTIVFDYSAYNWNRYDIGEILYFKDGLFVFIKEDSNGKINPTVLSKDPNATLGSLESLHELSGMWSNGSDYITIDKDGTLAMSISYAEYSYASLSFNGHLILNKDIRGSFYSYGTYINYENTGNELKIGEQTFTKLQDVPENFCGTWYRMNDWYNGANAGEVFNITHSGACFTSDASSVFGFVNYSANTLNFRNGSSTTFSIDYMSEDYLILRQPNSYTFVIYNRDPQNTTVSIESDPNLLGTWLSEEYPERYITINEDGTIREKYYSEKTGRYFTHKGKLYSTMGLHSSYSYSIYEYQITDNELLLGDFKYKKETVTE